MPALTTLPIHALIAAAVLAASLALLLALVLATARANQKLRSRLDLLETAAAGRDQELKRAFDTLRAEVQELGKSIAVMPNLPGGGGVNLTRRSQALRMHRCGESPEKIASALGMSRSEVDLLLKVHRTLVARL